MRTLGVAAAATAVALCLAGSAANAATFPNLGEARNEARNNVTSEPKSAIVDNVHWRRHHYRRHHDRHHRFGFVILRRW